MFWMQPCDALPGWSFTRQEGRRRFNSLSPGEREKRIEDCDPTNNFGRHPRCKAGGFPA